MIGFVNRAFEGWVTQHYGLETWYRVSERVGTSVFVGPEEYDDGVTADLAQAIADETGLRTEDLLGRVGEHLGRTVARGVTVMLEPGAMTFERFLQRLPDLQTRLELLCPSGRPQRFTISGEGHRSLSIVHYTTRTGLSALFAGTITGLASVFGVEARVSCRRVSSEPGIRHEYRVRWRETKAGLETPGRPSRGRSTSMRRPSSESQPAAD